MSKSQIKTPEILTAKDIRKLLDVKHTNDLVAHEAPIGPGGSGQIDTWVMRKSWAKASVIGYEIKVSRSDFLNDNKWQKYLPHCNEFYFVVAHGVCDPREVADPAGLLVAAKTGTRLFTKLKAPYRTDVDGIEDVMRSLLMNRAKIATSRLGVHHLTREERMENWSQSLDNRHMLSMRISRAISDEWDRLNREISASNNVAKSCDGFREILTEHGFDPGASAWRFRSDLRKKLGMDVGKVIDVAMERLEDIRKRLPSGDEG